MATLSAAAAPNPFGPHSADATNWQRGSQGPWRELTPPPRAEVSSDGWP
eukprot:CAMPEP_0174753574 /NCGR_PEP_ID=MMETSP1094-20130205/104282_1 /TAXON_ID=156173 /ORGANISM="Chrysochromulina brevifilum, Strain UTEX LB 985" /LENGTH=48 /DNA_ID= /DNA_START= /DNA_END= /DNA_ORIENTATION=